MCRLFLTLFLLLTLTSQAGAYERKTIQVALLLDTSNSMDGLIDQAKSQLWQIVNELSAMRFYGEEPELFIALYEYGNDNLSLTSGYIRMLSNFTQELDIISGKLFSLKTRGGSEYCGKVILKATKQLRWSPNKKDLKLIFIAGNEPFTQGPVHYMEAITEAKLKNIIVNTIYCGNWNKGIQGLWKNGALQSGGEYLNIDQDVKIIDIPTPYDDQLLVYNNDLNATYIGFGVEGSQRLVFQKTQDNNAYSQGKSKAVSRAISKSKRAYRNISWDLVDATESDPNLLKKLNTEDLPKKFQGLTYETMEKEIEKIRSERKRIKAQIAEFEIKRKEFMVEERAKGSQEEDSLDSAVLKVLRKQAVIDPEKK